MKSNQKKPKATISQKIIGAWLKHDPFVRLIAKNDDQVRYSAMMAMLGERAAKNYYQKLKKYNPGPSLIYPSHIREKEQEFLKHPKKHELIIRQLVAWGTDKYLNSQNIESHKTRAQIIHALLGTLFLNATEKEETLIIDAIKVLVISKGTHIGKRGEQSPFVHQEILQKVCDILYFDRLRIQGKKDQQQELAMKAVLIKNIQEMKDRHSAYYANSRQLKPRKLVNLKFPLKPKTKIGLIKIVRHYTCSSDPKVRQHANTTLKTIEDNS